jgi:nicotinamidase-related amidase
MSDNIVIWAVDSQDMLMLGLVVIDMQKWMFRYPERKAQVPSLLRSINSLISSFGRARLPIFDVLTIHKPDRSTWSRLMKKYDYSCLIQGTEDAEPVDGYGAPPEAIRITKTTNSAFIGTDFDRELRAAGVTELVLAGVFIDGCVGLTAADAAQRGYNVTFMEDGIGHTEEGRRTLILDWLADDYELRVETTAQICRRLDNEDAETDTV